MESERAIEETARRYGEGKRASFHYVRSKMAHDPVVREARARARGTRVLDLGCGRGQMSVLLSLEDPARAVVAIDVDGEKVDAGRRAGEGLSIEWITADLSQGAFDEPWACTPFDTILMLDVLHYMPRERQDALLGHALSLLAEGGVLLIRELDNARGFRSFATRVEERLAILLGINRGQGLFPRPAAELGGLCVEAGLRVEILPMWGALPFANVLLVAER